MAITQDRYELFDSYFLGRMSGEDKANFEKSLEQNAELANDFKEFQLITEGLQEAGENNFRQSLKIVDAEIGEPELNKSSFRIYWAAAAVIALLLGIGSVIYFTRGINKDRLYLAYYQHYKNDLVQYSRGEGITTKVENLTDDQYKILTEAMRAYDKKDYEKTIDLIEDNLIIKNPDPGIVFFLAVSQLELNRVDEAIENLEYLIEESNHAYFEQAQWYLSLAYIKANYIEKARLLLKEISMKSKKYQSSAEELLKKLH